MREIEFRIRHRGGEWFYGVPLTQIRNGAVGFKSFNNDYYDLFADAETLGQFTGLKDKNGVKIYEGDIVKMLNIDEYPMQIKWSEKWARFIFYNLVDKKEMNLFTEQCEVIGNIYDNPELIKESE